MRHLKLLVAVLSGVSLAIVTGLIVNVITEHSVVSNVAAAAAGALAAISIRADA